MSTSNKQLCSKETAMMARTESPIIHLASRGISPVILLIGLYVFFHGHYSPGGGFQGGVLLAAAILLLRLSLGSALSQPIMPSWVTLRLSALGALIFAGIGLVSIFFGGNFLDYHYLPMPWLDPVYLRYYGILLVEVGVTITVMTTLVAIYDDLLGC
ncbi:multicomponent Na+:H+ antiporter subunit B [Desulfonatronum thiosulfatophilum]|uniref:Multicomponent Na+:H+ antiporter subunit B n=1 Tax=Desulfonatronum thiosulfatophilum TaxID=617002 RepID=A0A1G6EN44_9BACT|nr:MnhB domain-containing protein [Desulfonatronum thiosulfatophilum]SDB58858.1 multicomponent Na+:H+ antiporter subunit B [Desulfonatronum thiosulfatophilum]